MDVLILIGRILFSALFLVSAFGHLTKREMMAGYAAGRGVPGAKVLVPVTGIQIAIGAIMVAFGLWPDQPPAAPGPGPTGQPGPVQ